MDLLCDIASLYQKETLKEVHAERLRTGKCASGKLRTPNLFALSEVFLLSLEGARVSTLFSLCAFPAVALVVILFSSLKPDSSQWLVANDPSSRRHGRSNTIVVKSCFLSFRASSPTSTNDGCPGDSPPRQIVRYPLRAFSRYSIELEYVCHM